MTTLPTQPPPARETGTPSETVTDFYRLLEIDPAASPEVVNKAYRALVQKYHPDQYHVSKKARMESLMKDINLAYETISDPGRRRAYDRQRRRAVLADHPPGNSPWRHPVVWLGLLAVILFMLKRTGRALLMIPAGKLMMLAGLVMLFWVWRRRRMKG
ncbi:MAG: J domain-containing protein [Candidatus Melainabacteria bacterium]